MSFQHLNFEFEAIFGADKCYFGEKEYLLGEVLIEFLNYDETYIVDLLDKSSDILDSIGDKKLTFEECETKIIEIDSMVTEVNKQITALPIYRDFEDERFDLRNPFLDNIYFHREENKKSYEHALVTDTPMDCVYFIECVELLLNQYITIANDIYRMKTVYSNMLDNYINRKGAMPNIKEISLSIHKYLEDNPEDLLREKFDFTEYDLFVCTKNVSISHRIKTLNSENFSSENSMQHLQSGHLQMQNACQDSLPVPDNEFILCEVISGSDLNDFIYLEFFRALTIGYIPKKCKNCGRYFLIKGGYNLEYCDRIAPNETTKTCSMVGNTNTFSEKVKQNPVWMEYTKLYKRYCARRKKGKMTDAEVSAWVVFSSNKRDELLSNESDTGAVNEDFLEQYRFEIDWDKNKDNIMRNF